MDLLYELLIAMAEISFMLQILPTFPGIPGFSPVQCENEFENIPLPVLSSLNAKITFLSLILSIFSNYNFRP